VGGDCDSYGIGAGYFVNSGRRNLDMTYIVFNNGVYGLTKGQASPTLGKGLQTKSMPEPSIQEGVNPLAVALGAGYTWIGRGYALDVKSLVSLIVQAIQHKGTSFLDVFQTCPVYNDLRTKEWYAGEDIGRTRLRRLDADAGWDPVVRDPGNLDEVVQKKTRALQTSYETGDSLAVWGASRVGLGKTAGLDRPGVPASTASPSLSSTGVVEAIRFVSPDAGWVVVGSMHADQTVSRRLLHTSDGGRHWSSQLAWSA